MNIVYGVLRYNTSTSICVEDLWNLYLHGDLKLHKTMTINNIPHQHMDKPTHTYKLIYFESYVVFSVSYFEQ